MIIERDIHPERNLFCIGAEILSSMWEYQFGVVPTLLLFEKVSKKTKHPASFDDFMLSLDWLFLLGVIEHDEKGDIVRCF